LDFIYETNPLDGSCDQRVHLSTEPLVLTYDVRTFCRVNEMFQSQEISELNQLHSVAKQKLHALKNTSSLGLEYAIQTHTVLDVDIEMKGMKFNFQIVIQVYFQHNTMYNFIE